MSNWQGGIRVNAFVSGGLIKTKAPDMVGKKLDGFTHACDW
jgi:arylsulfatase I/J